MNKRHRVLHAVFALWICVFVACGDDDSADPNPEREDSYDGEWICYDYGNECPCHISKGEETPNADVSIVDKCDWLTCCVRYRDSYSLRCDCENVRPDDCPRLTEDKTDATVVPQCPP